MASPRVRAQLMQQRLQQIDLGVKKSFVEIGFWLLEDEQFGYWQYLCDREGNGFRSHDDYMSRGTPFSRGHNYAAKAIVKEFSPLLPRSEMERIDRGNFNLLRLLPQRTVKEWVPMAQEVGPQQLRDALIQKEPTLLLEAKAKMMFNLYQSQFELIDRKLKQTMQVHDISREAALELWAAEREEDGETGL